MSSILKALEKVEQTESARRSGGAGSLIKTRPRRPAWILPAGVLGGAAVASLITFAAMGGFSKPHAASPQPDTALSAARPAPVAPVLPGKPQEVQRMSAPATPGQPNSTTPAVTAIKAKQLPVAASGKSAPALRTPVVSAKGAAALSSKGAPAVAAKAASAVAAKAAPSGKKTAVSAKTAHSGERGAKKKERHVSSASAKAAKLAHRSPEKHARALPDMPAVPPPAVRPAYAQPVPAQPASVKPAPLPVAAPPAAPHKSGPEVRVNGIAWQHDSDSSAALVNGRMVQNGAVVDGYKVERIFEDKVRFSGKNGSIEIPLGGGE